MSAVLDSAVTREIDLRMRLTTLIARVESEVYFMQMPGNTPDALARTVIRLNAALAEAGSL